MGKCPIAYNISTPDGITSLPQSRNIKDKHPRDFTSRYLLLTHDVYIIAYKKKKNYNMVYFIESEILYTYIINADSIIFSAAQLILKYHRKTYAFLWNENYLFPLYNN